MSLVLHLFNVLSGVLPNRGGFALRRRVLAAAGAEVGSGVRIATGVRVYDRNVEIGHDTWVGMGTRLISCTYGRVRIGARVDIAPMCLISTGTHVIGGPERRAGSGAGQDVVIGDGSWVGMGCILLPGAFVGSGSVVAAGAVVTAGIYPPNVLLAGIPAQVVRNLDSGTGYRVGARS